MSEIFLDDVIDCGVLDEPYTTIRSTGVFARGGFQTTPTNIPSSGVVSVATDEDLQMIPEGDRVGGAMIFHSTSRIYLTQQDGDTETGAQYISDQILWEGNLYRIMRVSPYENRGYWRAVGVRKSGV